MTNQELKQLIENNITGNTTVIVNSPDNVHFDAVVISDQFTKVPSKVKQQKIVYEALGNKIETGEVHAISLKTYTPEVWERLSNK